MKEEERIPTLRDIAAYALYRNAYEGQSDAIKYILSNPDVGGMEVPKVLKRYADWRRYSAKACKENASKGGEAK